MPKDCPPDKILNPKTGRCIMKKNAYKYGIPVLSPVIPSKHPKKPNESPKKKSTESIKQPKKLSDSPKKKSTESPKKSNESPKKKSVESPKKPDESPKKKPESPKKECVVSPPKNYGINYFFKPIMKYFVKTPDKNLIEKAIVLQKELQKAKKRLQIVENEYMLQKLKVGEVIYGNLLDDFDKYVAEAYQTVYIIPYLLRLKRAQKNLEYDKILDVITPLIPIDEKSSFDDFAKKFKDKSKEVDIKLKPVALSYKNVSDQYNKLYKEFSNIQKKIPKLAPHNECSPVSSGPGILTNKYLIVGNGYELPVKSEEREIVPMNQTLVLFTFCGLNNYTNKTCKFTEFFHNPKNSKILSDPIKYKDKIEDGLGYPIRIYKPGDKMPSIYTNLFSGYTKENKTSIVKSGVFKSGVMSKLDFNIVKKSNMFAKYGRECFDYSGSIKSPEDYTPSIHKEIYKDNVYKPANIYFPFELAKNIKYLLSDIMKTVGDGVYYFVGCRDINNNILPNNVIAMSDSQQNKK